MYQDFAIDEPRMRPIYDACGEFGLVVQMHCGRDVAFPPDDDRAEPARTRIALEQSPGMDFIATHMGGWRMWEESSELLVGADCYMETSFSVEELGGPRLASMIRTHGVDRVMFGTDSPWAHQAEDLARICKLPLSPEELDKILYLNAARLLGL
jgi:predicted TIM-barrel fold metal-dependent hydrolase